MTPPPASCVSSSPVPATEAIPSPPPQATGFAGRLSRREPSVCVQAEKYLTLARAAEADGDLGSAAAAYRISLTFLGEEDPEYDTAREFIARAEELAGEGYVRRAGVAERDRRWEEARDLWCRAAKLRPRDPHAQERAANSILECKGDLHEAERLAQAATTLEPANADLRCTLVRVLFAAALVPRARREVEAGLAQAPNNPLLLHLQKKLAALGP